MRCVYLGRPRGASALARAGHVVLAAGLDARVKGAPLGLDVTCPVVYRPDMTAPSVQRLFATAGADLLVCYLWDRLLPSSLIEAMPDIIGYHPSLLPRHRGADPDFWTIWSGDDNAGISVMTVDSGVDTGRVVAQRRVSVPAGATAGVLADLLDPLGLELLLEVVARWEREGPLEGVEQDHGRATEAPAPGDDLLEIDWSRPAREIAQLVRAAAPHPGAFTSIELDGRPTTLVILAAHEASLKTAGALEPGDAVLFEEGVVIWTGEGGLVLDEVQLEGCSYGDGPTFLAIFIEQLFDKNC